MAEKIIQVDMNKLKELFSKFNDRNNMYGLINSCKSLEYRLDENKWFTLSQTIIETSERVDNVNNTLLEIRKLLISGGCLLD